METFILSIGPIFLLRGPTFFPSGTGNYMDNFHEIICSLLLPLTRKHFFKVNYEADTELLENIEMSQAHTSM